MMHERFEALLDQVERQFRRASSQVSLSTKRYANRRLTEITPKIERVGRENAYQDFLLDHIQQQKEQFQLYREFRDADTEDEEEFLSTRYQDALREKPVCTCSGKFAHNCPLKEGKLPIEVRNDSDIDDGIREFKASHSGQPLVLLDAQQEFAGLIADVEADLRDLIAVLTTDEVPADAPEADAQPAEQPSD
ncbi:MULTISPECIES: hypothetical protein [Halolamina]|nr:MULTISPECIES: hypothetical protein [Halolamina]NHX37814.1 hypothetical protein [Halolamina sp. R1-12]